jgi:hypothetical protein
MACLDAHLYEIEYRFFGSIKYYDPMHGTLLDAQNSRNNSVGQCQFMVENDEKNNLKNLYLLDLKMWGLKRCSFNLIYFKY